MRNSTYRVLLLLAWASLLTGCGKPSHCSGSSDTSTAASDHVTADTIASRLLGGQFAPNQGGFQAVRPLECSGTRKDNERVVRCQVSLADGQRGGRPAFLEIQLFDRDKNFTPLDKPVKDNVASLGGKWSLDIDPAIVLTTKSTGQKAKLDGACHQALGSSNSAAFCTVLFTPRVFLITGVRPAHSSTTSFTFGDAADRNAQDIEHAKELAVLAIAMIGRSL